MRAQLEVAFAPVTAADAERDRIEAMHLAMPDFWNRAVQQKLGVPPEWQWYRLQVIGVDTLVTGAVPIGYTKGGSPKWPKVSESQVCVITDAERRAVRDAWTAETGLCWNCGGSGMEFASWNHVTGKKYRPCHRCRLEVPRAD